MKYDLIILTDHRYVKDDTDPYKHNVFYEDQLVLEACLEAGLKVSRKAWDDKHMDWSTTTAVLFRSTWDYFDRFNEFSEWLAKVSLETTLINSSHLIHWNIDKHYLLELSKKGIRIPETAFLKKGSKESLTDLHKSLGWPKSVLKPCISGAGRHTYLIDDTSVGTYESIFKNLISQEDMMLQPFQDHIVDQGEISMMLFNGEFTHAILKKAKDGDFRVQDDFGGSIHNYTPNSLEINFAKQALKACPELPLYARIDIFYDNEDQLALGELELIEPELWFRNAPDAAKVLAKHLKHRLHED